MQLDATETGLSNKTDSELKRSILTYKLMNSSLGSLGIKILSASNLPLKIGFSKRLIKKMVYNEFVGGESFEELQRIVKKLEESKVKVIIDFALEANSGEISIENLKLKILEILEFSSKHKNVFGSCIKITAFCKHSILEKVSKQQKLSSAEDEIFQLALKHISEIGAQAEKLKVPLFIDAEESWIQPAIDIIAKTLMQRHNKSACTIYNTYQMYLKSSLANLEEHLKDASANAYNLGVKVVRGAYMDKEQERAIKKEYDSPVQHTKDETDIDFDKAVDILGASDNGYVCIATHNVHSCELGIEHKNINSGRMIFSQLYGMSDSLTYNLAQKKAIATKYLPYGTIEMAMPYLIRRAQENKSMRNEMSRELSSLVNELKRRKRE